MKKSIVLLTALVISSSLSLAACGKKEETPTEKPEPSAEIVKPEVETKAKNPKLEYQESVATQLQDLNNQIVKLQAEIQQAEAARQEKLNQKIADLVKKMELRAQLNAELEREMSSFLAEIQKQPQFSSQLNSLIEQQLIVQEKLDKLKTADKTNWQQAKQEVDTAIAALKAKYSEVKALAKSNSKLVVDQTPKSNQEPLIEEKNQQELDSKAKPETEVNQPQQ